MPKPISISLSPNTLPQDLLLAKSLLFSQSDWEKGTATEKLGKVLSDYLEIQHAITFVNGRAALFAILKTLGIGPRDEVLLQAFTCVAVPNPVIWVGAQPIFVDIDKETFNLDISDLERKITSRSKAIIVQHTFGFPTPMHKIAPFARKHNLWVIEDCAHSLGAKLNNQKVGTLGDAAFFSFGKDKVIGVASGGAAAFNKNLTHLNTKLKEIQQQLPHPPKSWIFRQLLSPITADLILKTYNYLNLGKFLHQALLSSRLRLKANTWGEKKEADKPPWIPAQMPKALAKLALNQFEHLETFNRRRRQIAKLYSEKLEPLSKQFSPQLKLPTPHYDNTYHYSTSHQRISIKPIFLRFPILVSKPQKLMNFAKKHGVILGDWYNQVVAPKDVNLKAVGYQMGSCPVAKEVSQKIVNLPTNPTISDIDVERVIKVLQAFFAKT